jgi:hypothetical protein
MGEMPDPGAPHNSTRDIDAGRLVNQDLGKRSFVWHDSVVFQRLAWLLMTITPALGTVVLTACLGVSLDNFTPASSDEVGYYLQINAFVHRGFSGGYFTISENPAPASFSHFGVHGPLFPVLYGTIGKLVGWEFRTGPFLNLALLTLSIAVYCVAIRPTVSQALLGTALLATFWPFYLCVLSVLQDPVHWAVAIVVATGFCGLLRSKSWADSWLFRLLFVGVLAYASLMRISWAMFLIPYAVLQLKRPTLGRLAVAVALAVIGMAALLYAFRWLCAPYVGAPRAFFMNKLVGGEASVHSLLNQVYWNLKQLITGDLSDQPMLVGKLIFWEAIAFGCLAVLSLFNRWTSRPHSDLATRELWFHAFNIWALLAGIVLFYFVGNDGGWRMFGVHMLVSGFIAITSAVRPLKTAMIAIVLVNAAGLPWCMASIQAMNWPRFQLAEHIRKIQSPFGQLIQYRQDTDSWQNTMLVGPYPIELLALPPGIGVSFYGNRPNEVHQPIKSRYVLAERETVRRQNWSLQEIIRIRGLRNSIGYQSPPFSASLYLNPAAAPGPPPP